MSYLVEQDVAKDAADAVNEIKNYTSYRLSVNTELMKITNKLYNALLQGEYNIDYFFSPALLKHDFLDELDTITNELESAGYTNTGIYDDDDNLIGLSIRYTRQEQN